MERHWLRFVCLAEFLLGSRSQDLTSGDLAICFRVGTYFMNILSKRFSVLFFGAGDARRRDAWQQ